MSVPTLLAFWAAAEARGHSLQPVHGILSEGDLVFWSVNRRETARRASDLSGARVVKIVPTAA
jgi:hypothetical protein